jgi:hypothetical protein
MRVELASSYAFSEAERSLGGKREGDTGIRNGNTFGFRQKEAACEGSS